MHAAAATEFRSWFQDQFPSVLPASVDDPPAQTRSRATQHTPRVEKRLENIPCEDHQEGGGGRRAIAIIDDLGLGIWRGRDRW